MTVSSQQWSHWITALETILRESDHHKEHMFGIHVHHAIEIAEKRLAASISEPQPDDIPSKGAT